MDELKINESFAKKYDSYRKAEELQKLKEKYDEAESSSSESESEDETAEAVNAKIEKDFFHTLACIKSKDSVLYESDKKFFREPSSSESDSEDESSQKQGLRKSKKPFLLKDYERKVILERDGVYESEDDGDVEKNVGLSYYAELNDIKKSFAEATRKHDEENSDEDILKKVDKRDLIENNDETTLEELDDYWKDSKLDEKEKFLRDYILDRKYREEPSQEETSESEEETLDFVEQQEKFEHSYDMRFEKPNQDFIKSYPRTIVSSVRRKDERKKIQRQERKKRKEEEKRKKIEELKRLKQLKREEIIQKLNRLKEASGNTDIKFSDRDINLEFDPSDHDQRMQEIFNEEFYAEEEDKKPQFSDMEDNDYGDYWGEYNGDENEWGDNEGYDETIPECEQPEFNMDCEYQPEPKKTKKDKKHKGRDKKKKSAFYDAVDQQNPIAQEEDSKTMSQHLEEYNAMDFDDLIGDMPVRFKYRSVPANDFGLSTEDILLADNATLNSWCSLKHVVQRRLPEEEEHLRRTYRKKARRNRAKHFERFYKELAEKEKKPTAVSANKENKKTKNDKEKSKDNSEEEEKKKAKDETEADEETPPVRHRKLNSSQRRRKKERLLHLSKLGIDPIDSKKLSRKAKYKKASHVNETYEALSKINKSRLAAYGLKPQKVLNKAKYGLNKKSKKKLK